MSRSILIVDDDPLVKTTLRSFFEDNNEDFILEGSVSNGKEALEFLNNHNVDIVISDLVMPVMAGLEFIQELKNRDYKGLILVLSNYSDFSLVREALLIGAADYLLKTDLNKRDLLERLKTLSSGIDAEVDQNVYYEKVDKKFQLSLLRDYLDEDAFSEDRLKSEAPSIYSQLSEGGVVCLLRCPPSPERSSLPMEKLSGMIATVYEAIPSMPLIRSGYAELTWFIPNVHADLDDKPVHLLLGLIQRQARLYFSLDISIFYSSILDSVDEIKKEFRLLREKSSQVFYGSSGIYRSEELVSAALPPDWSVKDFAAVIGQHRTDEEKMLEEISWRVEYCRKEKVSPRQLIAFFSGTIDIIGYIEKTSVNTMGRPETAEECSEAFFREAMRILSGDAEQVFSVRSREIQRVLKYINNNYRLRISLDELADEANLNKSYLCRLFKRETGQSVVEYITGLRIDKAIALMAEGHTYIKEVAEEVGFEDQFYFARVFRKTVGKSPSEYIKERL